MSLAAFFSTSDKYLLTDCKNGANYPYRTISLRPFSSMTSSLASIEATFKINSFSLTLTSLLFSDINPFFTVTYFTLSASAVDTLEE